MPQYPEENLNQIKEVIINCPSWIGDAVMSLPAIKGMRENFPQAKITLLANSWVAGLYKNLSFIDDIIFYSPKGVDRGLGGFIKAIGKIKKRKFELALLLQNAFRPALLTWLAAVPHRWGYATDGRGFLLTKAVPKDPQAQQGHQVYYYLRMLQKLGLKPAAPDIEIRLSPQQQERGRQLLISQGLDLKKAVVGIHPGASYGEAKRWLPERFARLADRLIGEEGLQVIFFGAQQEFPLVERIVSQMRYTPFILVGKTDLEELMSTISFCNIFIVNDSGPMHLAAALGTPLIAIFGPTDEKQTSPLGKGHLVIKKPFPCSPCSHRICPLDHRCMTAISVEEVYKAALNKIGIRQS